MPKYDEVGRVYKKRSDNPWPGILGAIFGILVFAAACGGS